MPYKNQCFEKKQNVYERALKLHRATRIIFNASSFSIGKESVPFLGFAYFECEIFTFYFSISLLALSRFRSLWWQEKNDEENKTPHFEWRPRTRSVRIVKLSVSNFEMWNSIAYTPQSIINTWCSYSMKNFLLFLGCWVIGPSILATALTIIIRFS